MDPALLKALIGGSLFGAFATLVIGIISGWTTRKAQESAEKKQAWEKEESEKKSLRDEIKHLEERNDKLQIDLDRVRGERDDAILALHTRHYQCNRVGQPCQLPEKATGE